MTVWASGMLATARGHDRGMPGRLRVRYQNILETIGKHRPPPAGAKSPALWGTRARLGELFEAGARSVKAAERHFVFRYRSPEHWLEVFRNYYGPTLKAFATLDAPAQAALERDLLALIDRFNRSGDGTMVVPSEYLEIVITRG